MYLNLMKYADICLEERPHEMVEIIHVEMGPYTRKSRVTWAQKVDFGGWIYEKKIGDMVNYLVKINNPLFIGGA